MAKSNLEYDQPHGKPRRIVVMGVAGCGKSTIGQALASQLGYVFLDGDDYHPAANVRKMSTGQPLTDADRWPWLDRLVQVMDEATSKTAGVIIACSALRRTYRDRLSPGTPPPLFLHLDGTRSLIEYRMAERQDHFMPLGLLDSQFATLEPLQPGEHALRIEIEASVDDIVGKIAELLD